jgi:hypothetical protein
MRTGDPVFETTLDPRGFIISCVAPLAEIELEHAKENTTKVHEISGDVVYPILVDMRKIRSISKEARDHFAMKDRKPGVVAIAMVVSSPLSRIIGNFFLGLNLPAVPTRMFSDRDQAERWLLSGKHAEHD